MPYFLTPLISIAVVCGTLIPIHAGMNATLSRSIGHPVWATVFSFMGSFVCLAVFAAVIRPGAPSAASLLSAPPWAWLSGLVGVVYVIVTMLVAPRLGAASFITSVIAGQMVMALLLDHYGLLGFSQKSVDLKRILGMLLVFAGVAVMQINRDS
ncbi:DMT family transporter [Marinobacterium jannaschii]|uniref:DMT family transporter n=1 Tax=Marinobacterium jannaschii TaxID=64970 RepID=UPI000482D413|nr:DMT family transporter [Marinobacterium jannaschii]